MACNFWLHVHIATEVFETLHPWVTGLYFITKVWLLTSIGLTSLMSNDGGILILISFYIYVYYSAHVHVWSAEN